MTKRDYVRYYWRNRCAYCDSATKKMTFDHVIPVSRGGTGSLRNLVLSCQKCNSSKRAALLGEFLREDPQRLSRINRALFDYDDNYAQLSLKGGKTHARISKTYAPQSTAPAPAYPARFRSLRRTGFGILGRVLGPDCADRTESAAVERR